MGTTLVETLKVAVFAEDANASAVLQAVQQQGERTASALTVQSTRAATVGSAQWRKLGNATNALGISLAGIPGPAGRAASALLVMASGGAVTAAVAVGVGVLAFAYRKLTADIREAEKAQQDFLAAAPAAFAQAFLTPVQAAERGLLRAREVQQAVREDLRRAQRGQFVATPGSREGGVFVVDPQAVEEATKQLRAANQAVLTAQKAVADARKQADDDAEASARKLAAARDAEIKALGELAGMDALRLQDIARLLELQEQVTAQLRDQAALTPSELVTLRGQAGTVGEAIRRGVLAPQPIAPIGGEGGQVGIRVRDVQEVAQATAVMSERFTEATAILNSLVVPQQLYNETLRQLDLLKPHIPQELYTAAVAEAARVYGQATRDIKISTQQFAVAAINTVSALIAAAASGGGGIGGFLSGVGGLVSFLPGPGQIAGAVLQGVGRVISASERDEPQAVRIADIDNRAAEKLRAPRTGPDRVTIITDRFANPIDVLEEYHRLTQRDALDRLRGEEVPVVE